MMLVPMVFRDAGLLTQYLNIGVFRYMMLCSVKSWKNKSSEDAVQVLTLSDFEKMAVKYSELFYFRSLKGGPKDIAYWTSNVFFMLTLLFMFSSVGAWMSGREASTALAAVAVIFELLGLIVWMVFYEPVYRSDKLKRSGIPDSLCQKQDRETVKSIWLKQNLPVSPDKYLEVTKTFYEVQGMLVESRKNRQLGDRFLMGFFSLKPLQSVLSIPVILALLNFALRIPGVHFTAADIDISVLAGNAAKYSLTLFLVAITLVLTTGMLLTMVVGISELISERYRGKCADLTRKRFVRALLERADLAG
ncbi:hypothetical protein V2J84_10795 [Pseudomonas alliivorans]|nr:hypothetical protein [Pseudomonas alliivorans]